MSTSSERIQTQLAPFSIGRTVKDSWLIVKNEHIIGLFHGMFDRNMRRFNLGLPQTTDKCGMTY